jgi:hypothetical protein
VRDAAALHAAALPACEHLAVALTKGVCYMSEQMLLALDRNNNPGQGAPVSEEQLAALPHHSYTSAKQVTGSVLTALQG